MPRRLALFVFLGAVLLLAGVYGAAALTSVTINRSAVVSVDDDSSATAAVRFECLDNSGAGGTNYSALCQYSAGGVLTLELHRVLNSNGTILFNRSASYTVGSTAASNRVLKITNNSATDLTVGLQSVAADMTMVKSDGTNATDAAPVTIAAGTNAEFYFTITAPASGSLGTNTLQVRKAS